MSFRLNDLKKSVRKGKDGHQVSPARLEGRPHAFRIEFLLQQFEGHLGCPRRLLDPDALLDFVGDARLGRGLLATLSQWYRMRPRTFAEVLPDGGAGLLERGISGPIDLRAWLYEAVNRGGRGYLDPEAEPVFWQAQSRALGVRREALQKLTVLDRPEEAVLVRTGPAPTPADVMAAYNARAHTTLLRSALDLSLHCAAPARELERAARHWPNALGVEWRIEGSMLQLFGRADALGCWTRHGRHLERAALELLALPNLAIRELHGRVAIGERTCRFRWATDTLAALGTGQGDPLPAPLECGGLTPLSSPVPHAAQVRDETEPSLVLPSPPSTPSSEKSDVKPPHSKAPSLIPQQVEALAALLRRERDGAGDWGIRRAGHLVAVEAGVFLPHLELRRGDLALYLRLTGSSQEPDTARHLQPFRGKTPIALVAWSGSEDAALSLQLPDEAPQLCLPGTLLTTLAAHLEEERPARRAA
jgi:hypothetical protein